MPFNWPRSVTQYKTALKGEAKGLRQRASRLKRMANAKPRRQAPQPPELKEVRLFVARVMDEAADLIDKRLFDAEVHGGPVPPPEWR